MHRPVAAILSAALATSLALPLLAGPLDPPPGPVTSTMKPLDQVEPRTAIGQDTTPGDADSLYRITQAGSYYLAGNVLGVSGKTGIEITVSDVTIDLMGFEMKGAVGTLDGIKSIGDLGNITIRNGTVAIWRQDGIDFGTALSSHVEQVRAAYNFDVGIRIGARAVITGVTAPGHPNGGILAGPAATISGCTASVNTGPGIKSGNDSTLTGCVAIGNLDDGFELGAGCTVTSCTAADNSKMGIYAGANASVVNCTGRSNGYDGLNIGDGSTVSDCSASENGQDGFQFSKGNTVAFCAAKDNADNGFVLATENAITACTATSNDDQGFYLKADNRISGCTATTNGGAGIIATGAGNTIDGNSLVKNQRGIHLQWPDNFIVRNSARGNTTQNYDFSGFSETYGPLVSGPGQIATSSPWANFAF